ncbi:C2H2 transcription factor [Paecilomyces variotii No. 5]|uniref:C2H2 transcription factor n=1 Tax=Byssochlamys spectabilis (strain No. 5 / NBRC 109023) TaxID=1356009 RepID=V5HUA5_BYSSN|nr:C2H2 transcription factor [Paecilomyces variotii No. 5]
MDIFFATIPSVLLSSLIYCLSFYLPIFRPLKNVSLLLTKSRDLLTRHDRLTHRVNVAIPPEPQQEPISPTSIARVSATESLSEVNDPLLNDQVVGNVLEGGLSQKTIPDLATSQSTVGIDFESLQTPADFFYSDFTAFMDNVVIPSNPFSPSYQPIPTFSPDDPIHQSSPIQEQLDPDMTAENTDSGELTPGHSLASAFGSRLPSLQPEDPGPTPPQVIQHKSHLIVSVGCRARLEHELEQLKDRVPKAFSLPSRHTLSRLVMAYFRAFHEHYPFLHAPTIRLDKLSPGLFLGILALGGRYSREPELSMELFVVAKAVAMEQMRQQKMTSPDSSLRPRRDSQASMAQSKKARQTFGNHDVTRGLELAQTFLLLIAIATWFNGEPDAYEAMAMRSIVDSLLREYTMNNAEKPDASGWEAWIFSETVKRTQLVAFSLFNIHTIVFDLPPMMLPEDVDIELPCSEKEWKADSESVWAKSRTKQSSMSFRESLEVLFKYRPDAGLPRPPRFSSLGGFALIHAIIQRIWLFRHTQFSRQRKYGGLTLSDISLFERALKNWSNCWESDLERSIDPLSPHGPLSFTSTALLRLAYIRLNMDLGPARSLSTWNADLIAKSLDQYSSVQRSEKLTRAALHCAHALSIPVQLGLKFVSKTQVVYWSNQHALCSLECAVLLAKWLEAVTQPHLNPPLTPAEEKVLVFLVQLVVETDNTQNFQDVLQRRAMLSAATVRLWATLYDCDSVWQMVNLIGQSLNAYAELLEDRYHLWPIHGS